MRPISGVITALLAIAATMVPEMTVTGLEYPWLRRRRAARPLSCTASFNPYHVPGRDIALMDWDLPKGKRARRRARGRKAAAA